MFVDGHQVVSLAPRFRKAPLQKLVKRFQVLQPPILSCSNLAQISSQFHETSIPFRTSPLLPGEDLVDLAEHEQGAPFFQLGSGRRVLSNQAHQSNQRRLLVGAPVATHSDPPCPGKVPDRDSWYRGSGESECHCAGGSVPPRFGSRSFRPDAETLRAANR